eukprot:COSAG02_NODE_19839_length_862_cov_1.082569_1_plen_79_part_00
MVCCAAHSPRATRKQTLLGTLCGGSSSSRLLATQQRSRRRLHATLHEESEGHVRHRSGRDRALAMHFSRLHCQARLRG